MNEKLGPVGPMDLNGYVCQHRDALDRIAAKAGWRIIGWSSPPASAETAGPVLALVVESVSPGAALSKEYNAGLMGGALGIDVMMLWPDEVTGTDVRPW